MKEFKKLVYTPARSADATLAIAACRAGGIGIFNAELETDTGLIFRALDCISDKACGNYGIKLDAANDGLLVGIQRYVPKGLRWLILDCEIVASCQQSIAGFRRNGVYVLAEIKTPHWPDQPLESLLDGLVLKGNEAGGFVGENSSFILLQKWRKQTKLPLYVHGGITPNVAAACSALGVFGGVLDSQVLLLDESPLAHPLRPYLENLSGNETVAVGNGEQGHYFRLLVRPGHRYAQEFSAEAEGQGSETLKLLVQDKINWTEPRQGLLPIGQDVCFAGPWRKQYSHMAAVFQAIDSSIDANLRLAVKVRPLSNNSSLAQALGIPLPVVQGPMTRTSDKAEFARAVSQGGALPMLAFALLKGDALKQLLSETKDLLEDRPWGIGLLGFAPQTLLDEQIAIAKNYQPDYAIIAGGRPDQAVRLEAAGIRSFLHVPSSNLIPLFLQEGARRFIFEGRECGGHIGPLSSFVLWSSMVDRLLAELNDDKIVGTDIQVLFAGGIHDAVSSAIVQVLTSPLLNKGVKIGILMGSGYLFTKEIVATGAIVPTFQKEVIECDRTVNLESGPGHASRCAYSPFARTFFRMREDMRKKNVPNDESRKILDDLILGRLRIATKGLARMGDDGELRKLDEDVQQREGMYMLGQVATLRADVTDIPTLHREVTEDANALLAMRLDEIAHPGIVPGESADIAIIGIASLLPKAISTEDYWENILNKVDAITEIPSHRWDWRLYYDEDRTAKDKIYSKWGGFLDDLAFDPTRYGMPPKSIESVDPMQLMALEVAQRTLTDAGYENRQFNRERASVIIGASGGVGDVGMQYGLRAELPRFLGELPDSVASRLPKWTEDTFAGILLNVIAGRIANRLNFGGVNFATDAACASSLAAIYQGVSELAAGRSDFVIAGGVDTVQGPFGYLCFSKTQALSPQGRCKTFDSSADGIVISEGIAMIALKRLADAERDGDRIYAVIKGVGGSSDGNAKGLTAPLPAGQLLAMRRAYQQAGFGPETVSLFEAHGTGTVAGDTAELKSTTNLIKDAGGRPHQAVVGSVKTLIGHTKAAAGVAGLIKATLALKHRTLPPHHGVSQPNQVLQQADCPLYLANEALPWLATKDTPRRAAVSAFGFGGTNFHVVLEEYAREYRPWMYSAVRQRWPTELLFWRGNDREGLIAQLTHLQQELPRTQNIELRDLAYSLAVNCQTGTQAVAIIAKNVGDLQNKIGIALGYFSGVNAQLPTGIYHSVNSEPGGKVAVLFSGQGSQYTGMLREIALHFPVCADTLSEADDLLREAFSKRFGDGVRLSNFIFPRGCYDSQSKDQATIALTSTDVAQPALGAVEAGIWRLMRTLGLKPDMLAGHSYGEFVALFAGGYIDFNALMSLSEARGRFIVDSAKAAGAELGSMAAVQASREDVEKAIAGIDSVIVANHNSPQQIIISGSKSAIEEAVAKLSKTGINISQIPVAAAFHSRFVEPAQAALKDLIEKTDWRNGDISIYSNTTAEPHAEDIGHIKQLMSDHLVRPVEFMAEVEAMYRDGARVFLELGPKAILTKSVCRILDKKPYQAIAFDNKDSGITGLLNALGQLLCAGVSLDIMKLYEGRGCKSGDPADLASLQKNDSVSKHAWMINGSGVRGIGEPIKQIGIRAEDLGNNSLGSTKRDVRAPAISAISESNSMVTNKSVKLASTQRTKEVSQMNERRRTPVAGDSAVMAEYFETMRQFLETQERVMASFIGESSPEKNSGERSQRRDQPRPRLPTFATGRSGVPRQALRLAQPQMEMAAATPAQEDATAGKPAPTAGSAIVIGRNEMTSMLRTIVEDKTGYPQDMIGLDQNLEADLGIDSIKRIEIVGALLQALPDSYGQSLGENRSRLNTQSTLNGMLDLLSGLKIAMATAPIDAAPKSMQTDSVPASPDAGNEAKKPVAKIGSAIRINRNEMTGMLLTIVEDKTGYPQDMIGLDRNLEADLGIDSIKRIEIVGALLQALPNSYGQSLGENRSRLNTQSTLNGMLDMLSGLNGGGSVSIPFDQAGTGLESDPASHPPRYVIEPKQEPIDELAEKRLGQGHFLITQDIIGVATEISRMLSGRGCTVSLIEREALKSESSLNQWCADRKNEIDTLAGIVHLAPLSAEWLLPGASLADWKSQLQLNEKSLFLLLHNFSGKLADNAHVLTASALGGYFNRNHSVAPGLSLQGGAVGLLKSLHHERPLLRVKAVDIDPAQGAVSIAATLSNELELMGGRQEVGYPDGNRTVFQTIPASVGKDEERTATMHNIVVLATGGARGVTAEALRAIAFPGNTLVLTGRSALQEREPESLKGLITPEALRTYYVAEVRGGRLQLTPAEIQRKVQSILATREMRNNIEDFRARGATVEYHRADVNNEDALRQLLDSIYQQYGRIDGVVHGAGVIEDKLLADKTGDSWSRVVETKVFGVLLLQKYLRPESLRFFTVFSSVAGRYGNSGQTDYATANELMNRLCCQLRTLWGNQVNIMALCWGPWGQTKFGTGMVTVETEEKFTERGVVLVNAETGRRLFVDELGRKDHSHIEIVCGEGPWEQGEAAIGEIQKKLLVVAGTSPGPLLDNAIVMTLPKGERVITLNIGVNHIYLQDHCIDGVPVLPAAVALEIMAEAASSLWPDWNVIEIRDCKLMKGIELKKKDQKLKLVISPPPYGNSDGFEVNVTIQSEQEDGKQRIHYRSVVILAQQWPAGFEHKLQLKFNRKLTVAKAYDEWLFHGPRFRVIKRIYGQSEEGAKALANTTCPADWLISVAKEHNGWIFDPAIIDAAAQMAGLWARAYHNELALPARFGRVVRYSDTLPEQLYISLERLAPEDPHLVRANVYISDLNGHVLLLIEDMECVGSPALNRLCGTGNKPAEKSLRQDVVTFV